MVFSWIIFKQARSCWGFLHAVKIYKTELIRICKIVSPEKQDIVLLFDGYEGRACMVDNCCKAEKLRSEFLEKINVFRSCIFHKSTACTGDPVTYHLFSFAIHFGVFFTYIYICAINMLITWAAMKVYISRGSPLRFIFTSAVSQIFNDLFKITRYAVPKIN